MRYELSEFGIVLEVPLGEKLKFFTVELRLDLCLFISKFLDEAKRINMTNLTYLSVGRPWESPKESWLSGNLLF